MPFASMAQARWAHAAARRGDFPAEKLPEWDQSTDFKGLPERVGPQPPAGFKPPGKKRGPATGAQRSSWLRAAAKRRYSDTSKGERP